MNGISGPHQRIRVEQPRELLAVELFDRLWERYRGRVSYVGVYEQVVQQAGARFVNDHIAFRTFACQQPLAGIGSISRIFEALGYVPAGVYDFPDKQLSAIHYQHANPEFPKLFISELRVWELNGQAREIISRVLASHRQPCPLETLAELAALDQSRLAADRREQLLEEALAQFHQLPWELPQRQDVQRLNEHSQYAAWVLLHGYNVNHFTSLVNSHGVERLNGLEKTITALQAAGVPMKAEIEGEPGSKLRQSATEAVKIDVPVREGDQVVVLPWTYAYFELAERNLVTDPASGQRIRFEGFLGPQATHLFEMTRTGHKQ